MGLQRKETVPIINDGRGNRPTITVRQVSMLPGASWTGRDYGSMVGASYAVNSDVYACVSLIAQTAKQVRWDTSPGSVSRASIALLDKSGGPTFIENWVSYMLLSGNTYCEIGRNASGTPVSLYLLQPDRVSPVTNVTMPDPDYTRQPKILMWRVRDVKGNPYPLEVQFVMHSKTFNPFSELIGMPPLQAAMLLVDAQNEGATLMKRMLQAGFAPGWIEAAENSDWSDTQVAQLKERLRLSRQGGEALFLQNAKWHDIGFKPVESNVSEQQTLSKRDIASIFHVPPQLIGDTQSQTYSNYKEARLSLYMEAVFPGCTSSSATGTRRSARISTRGWRLTGTPSRASRRRATRRPTAYISSGPRGSSRKTKRGAIWSTIRPRAGTCSMRLRTSCRLRVRRAKVADRR